MALTAKNTLGVGGSAVAGFFIAGPIGALVMGIGSSIAAHYVQKAAPAPGYTPTQANLDRVNAIKKNMSAGLPVSAADTAFVQSALAFDHSPGNAPVLAPAPLVNVVVPSGRVIGTSAPKPICIDNCGPVDMWGMPVPAYVPGSPSPFLPGTTIPAR